MHKVMTDSKKYKILLRRFIHEKHGKLFTYKEFTHWMTDRQYLIVSNCGSGSIGQAIFTSVINHEFELVTNYRHSKDGQIETVYQIEKDKVSISNKIREPIIETNKNIGPRRGIDNELYCQ